MAERVDDGLVIVDQTLDSGGLIEFVANVDTLNIVDESGDRLSAERGCSELIHVVIDEVAEVVPGRGLG